jgi:DNA sulfur modification protein DndC
MIDLDALPNKLKAIRREIRAQYLEEDGARPWIIGFSGGKDSTLLTHLVVETLLAIAPDQRTRPVHLVCNDTLVESPVFHGFVGKMLANIEENIGALNVPVDVVRTHPLPEESFWVNLLGRGYPAPNRTFRWCTDRMKIRPTSRFIREQVSQGGGAVLLLGVRHDESATRSGSITRHARTAEGRLTKHSDHDGVWIFSPIQDLTTQEVWLTLISVRPPWGGSYDDVRTLYKNALGGECPFVVSNDDAPSCGSNSARFGCWTCTVVEKDNSLESLITIGHEELIPLADFRKRLKAVSETPDYRSKTRRNGQPGLGPLTFDARRMLLDELLAIQTEAGMELISGLEVRLIREQWVQDKNQESLRELAKAKPAVELSARFTPIA